MASLDKPRKGWEGINNGGEIYSNSSTNINLIKYNNTVKSVALQKIKNELLFNGIFESAIRRMEREGIVVNREQFLQDVNKEVTKQKIDIQNNISYTVPTSSISQSIDLSHIFENTTPQKVNVQERFTKNEESLPAQTTSNKEDKTQLRNEYNEALEQLNQTMNWATHQPNEPIIQKTNKPQQPDLPNDLYIQVDNNIIKYIEENYGKIDKILSLSGYPDKKYKIRFSNGKINEITIPKKESKTSIEKENIISELLQTMYQEKLEYIPLPDMKSKLNSMSIEELEQLKNQFYSQNIQSGMKR